MYREVIFDIETKKLFDQIEDRQRIEDLGVSVVSAYRRVLDDSYMEIEGEMASFGMRVCRVEENWVSYGSG